MVDLSFHHIVHCFKNCLSTLVSIKWHKFWLWRSYYAITFRNSEYLIAENNVGSTLGVLFGGILLGVLITTVIGFIIYKRLLKNPNKRYAVQLCNNVSWLYIIFNCNSSFVDKERIPKLCLPIIMHTVRRK